MAPSLIGSRNRPPLLPAPTWLSLLQNRTRGGEAEGKQTTLLPVSIPYLSPILILENNLVGDTGKWLNSLDATSGTNPEAAMTRLQDLGNITLSQD